MKTVRTAWVACAAAFLTSSVVPEGNASAAQTAAAIEYDVVAAPAGLRADFAAPAGVTLRFLAIKAIDGVRVDAALWQPGDKAAGSTTLVVTVHGSGGNFQGNPNGFLASGLVAKGYAVLGINTRQHDDRVNTDNFLDVRRDIEAAVYTARALGYRTLVLHGHSLGNIQVQFYAATNWDADLKAVVLTGTFANLPWKSRHLLVQNEENFRELSEAAFRSLRDGRADAVLPVRMGWITGQPVPVTAQHFLTYRWEPTSTADGTYWIRRIPRPVLLVRDQGDAIIEPFEPYMLLSAGTAAGSLPPSVKLLVLPNAKGRSAAAHGFSDNTQALVDAVAGWLGEQRL
jgi:alpha/beta hydrolase fold